MKIYGQMNMYMGYFARINIELVLEYETYNMDTNLFVSKYELYLPNKEELKKLVDKIINEDK